MCLWYWSVISSRSGAHLCLSAHRMIRIAAESQGPWPSASLPVPGSPCLAPAALGSQRESPDGAQQEPHVQRGIHPLANYLIHPISLQTYADVFSLPVPLRGDGDRRIHPVSSRASSQGIFLRGVSRSIPAPCLRAESLEAPSQCTGHQSETEMRVDLPPRGMGGRRRYKTIPFEPDGLGLCKFKFLHESRALPNPFAWIWSPVRAPLGGCKAGRGARWS